MTCNYGFTTVEDVMSNEYWTAGAGYGHSIIREEPNVSTDTQNMVLQTNHKNHSF